MNSSTVDLIATDPPWKKNRQFLGHGQSEGQEFKDNWYWEEEFHKGWLQHLEQHYPAMATAVWSGKENHSPAMGAYLCFMAPRIIEMHRVLKDTGSMYLHCDYTTQPYLRAMMDGLFGNGEGGKAGFKNDIVWDYRTGGIGKSHWPRKHDNLLYYTKSSNYQLELPREQSRDERRFNLTDSDGRKYYDKGGSRYYADNGVAITDCWVDIPPVRNVSKESTGWATQKPLKLYERIILASSNEGDVVLDPFCGCTTTLIAAWRLQRRWIGFDLSTQAEQRMEERIKKYPMLGSFNDVKMGYNIKSRKENMLRRTDNGGELIPPLTVPEKPKRTRNTPSYDRDEMRVKLARDHGVACQGCGYEPPTPKGELSPNLRYLDIDHRVPRSLGGKDEEENLCLLCPPCNRRKSNKMDLAELRRQNRAHGNIMDERKMTLKA